MTSSSSSPCTSCPGSNFPVGRLGALGALAIATLPFAVGLDALRQLVFAGEPYITGTPSPEVEALILAGMTIVFTLLARWMIRRIERMARARGPPLDPLAVSAITAPGTGRRPRRARPLDGAASIPRGPRAPASRTRSAASGPRSCSAGGSSRTGPTRRCSSSTRSRSRSRRAAPRRDDPDHRRRRRRPGHADVRDPRQRAMGDGHRRDPGPGLVRARRSRAISHAQVPRREPVAPARAARGPGRCAPRRGTMGTSVALVFSVIFLGLPDRPVGRPVAATSSSSCWSGSCRSWPSASSWRRSASRPARRAGRTRKPWPARCSS